MPELKLLPDRVIRGVGDIRTREDPKPTKGESTSVDNSLKQPHLPNAKMLIQELRSEVSASYQDMEDGGRVCVPEHSVGVNECREGRREVCVEVVLPGVRAAKDVELEVSQVSCWDGVDRLHFHSQPSGVIKDLRMSD